MPAIGLPGQALRLAWMLLSAAALVVCGHSAATAAEKLRVFAAGAVQGALLQLKPDIAAATGAELDAAFDTVGALRDRVLAGEAADLVLLSEAGVAALAKAGKLADGPKAGLGTISVALAVRKGTVVPDVSSPEALKRALLSAESIAHADPARGATAGTHFALVLEKLGVAGEIKHRVTVLPFGVEAIAGVAQGRFQMAASQSSEIAANPGVVLAGALPDPYARRTSYVAAPVKGAKPAAEAVLTFLQTPAARSAFQRFGFAANP